MDNHLVYEKRDAADPSSTITKILQTSRNADEARERLSMKNNFSTSQMALYGAEFDRIWGSFSQDPESNLSLSIIIESSGSKGTVLESLFGRTLSQAVPDSSVTNCHRCLSEFGYLFNTRHHCRACGRIFCDTCTQRTCEIPPELPSFEIPSLFPRRNRVCERCFENIAKYGMISKLIKNLYEWSLPIELTLRLSTLSCEWREATIYYLSAIRELQYRIPAHIFKPHETAFLVKNRHNFSGHSLWLLQYLRLANRVEDLEVLKGHRSLSCQEMMCGRECTARLRIEELIIIFASGAYPEIVRDTAVTQLMELHFNEIRPYLPLLLRCAVDHEKLSQYLANRVKNDPMIFNETYWYALSDTTRANEKLKNRLLTAAGRGLDASILGDTSGLLRMIDVLEKHYGNYNLVIEGLGRISGEFPSPFGMIKKIHLSEISIKNSNTAPIVIPCQIDDRESSILYKKEDLRKDLYCITIINLMYQLIKNRYDFRLITYKVIPTSAEGGFVEMVPGSRTLHEVLAYGSINNYIDKHNPNTEVGQLRNNFRNSLAFWTIVTYILAVGDRHLDNIMITEDGLLFHIDYGFIFGLDPKPTLGTSVRMDRNFLEGMGGETSYKEFKEICIEMYKEIRRHHSLIYSVMMIFSKAQPPISGYRFSGEFINHHLTERLLVGQNDEEVSSSMKTIIDNSKDSVLLKIRDLFHSVVSTYKTSR